MSFSKNFPIEYKTFRIGNKTFKIGFTLMLVDKEIALRWVTEYNLTNFRHKQNNSVKKYVQVMKSEGWLVGPAIYFDIEGNLLDGQNRLYAIIESGKSQIFPILCGFDTSSAPAFDNGMNRTKNQALRWLEMHNPKIMKMIDGAPKGSIGAAFSAFFAGLYERTLSNAEIESSILKHTDIFEFVRDHFFAQDEEGKRVKSKGVCRTHAVAAFARANYKYSNSPTTLKLLSKLAKQFVNGFDLGANPKMLGFDRCRGWLITSVALNGSSADKIIYQKVATCLEQALQGKNTTFKMPKTTGKKALIENTDFQDPF